MFRKPLKANGVFSNEIDLDPASLDAGLVVLHRSFGRGVVEELEGQAAQRKALVKFDEYDGVKKLMLRATKLYSP